MKYKFKLRKLEYEHFRNLSQMTSTDARSMSIVENVFIYSLPKHCLTHSRNTQGSKFLEFLYNILDRT